MEVSGGGTTGYTLAGIVLDGLRLGIGLRLVLADKVLQEGVDVVGRLGHCLLQRVGGVVGIAHDLSLLGTQLGNLDDKGEGVVLACTVGTMDGRFVDLLAQVAVVETGQQGLLRGVDDNDGVGSLPAPALGIFGALGNISIAKSGQLVLALNPHHSVVGGSRQHIAPLRLQLRDAQIDLLHPRHLVVRQQSTLTHKVLINLLQQLLVLALQCAVVTVVDLTDALEQLLVERYLVLQVGQHRLHLLLYLTHLVGLVGLNDGKEDAAHAVERLATLLEGKDGVLKGCRILVL